MAGKKTLYHSELVKAGAVEVEVKTDVLKSKYDGKPDYVAIILDGEERLYNCENEACATFFQDLKGIKLTILATGGRDEALIEEVDGGPAKPKAAAKPAARPAAASRPAAQAAPAAGEVTKPLRERLNDPAWGAFNVKEHLQKSNYAAKQVILATLALAKWQKETAGEEMTIEEKVRWHDRKYIGIEKANLMANCPTETPAKPAAAPKPQPKRDPEPPPQPDPADAPPDDDDSVPF